MQPARDGALEDGGDEADEAQEGATLTGGVGEEVVGHKGEGEFHAAKEEDEYEVCHVQ